MVAARRRILLLAAAPVRLQRRRGGAGRGRAGRRRLGGFLVPPRRARRQLSANRLFIRNLGPDPRRRRNLLPGVAQANLAPAHNGPNATGGQRQVSDQENAVRLDAGELEDFSTALFVACGVPAKDAGLTARSLVWADLRGIYSHGVVRLQPGYLKALQSGANNPRPEISVLLDGPAFAVFDGDRGMGQVAAERAVQTAMGKARESGIGLTCVRNSRHFGAAAYWPYLAAEEQMIGFSSSNGGVVNTAPYGGARSVMGNNPHAWVIPAGNDRPVILDMATGVAAMGKVMMARLHDQPLPEGWCMDSDGNDTTDPHAAVSMLPAGGAKGYAIGYVLDLISGALAGALTSPVKSLGGISGDEADQTGMTFLVIDIAAVTDAADFAATAEQTAAIVRQTPPRPGFDRVYVPGEIEWNTYDDRIVNGIPASQAEISVLAQMASEQGIESIC
ncbi:MAG: Ldh family oxidoreductase [Chloroflexi bacterium]|nr:Ldh family oxidoreductase [Chloroflexota bacterium]